MAFTITFVALLVLLVIGIPISISLMISGTLGYMLVVGWGAGYSSIAQTLYGHLNVFVITAIPLYILMGQIMLKGDVGRELFDIAQRLAGWLPGGLAIAAVFASAVFAAISGSSTATVATIGSISLPEMIDRGYEKRMAAGVVAVAGSLGILIPPSISFILYSLVTNTSVGKLFAAGILPGIMLAFLFSGYTVVAQLRRLRREGPSSPLAAAHRKPELHWTMIWSLLIIPLVLGGIYLGWFTPTEAAGIGATYALILTAAIKRTLSWRRLFDAFRDSVATSAMILMLIGGASIFGNALDLLQVPQNVAAWLNSLGLVQWQFLIMVNILYLFLGMFMDASAAILVTIPILLPSLTALGVNLIWFGVILIINMEIGAVTPPVGVNLFVVKALRDDYSIADILRGSLPYAVMGLVGLALVMLIPQIALLLANRVT